MEFTQTHTSVFSHINAVPCDLATVRNTVRLIHENKIAKAGGPDKVKPRTMYMPVVLVGPSGAGKSTIIKKMEELYPNKFGFSVSYTTRKMRAGEVDGVHYNFVTKEKFQDMIAKDEFIEHCQVHDNLYGTAKEQIIAI